MDKRNPVKKDDKKIRTPRIIFTNDTDERDTKKKDEIIPPSIH